jgi:2-polyprenyl-6-methoxyphenol hydroxylase-like FAD-dependent oxidoreductase
MNSTVLNVDVLIVGAGPVGLFLANECARRGLRHRIVETNATQSVHSKALAIFPRTLEIFDMAGVVAPFLEAANCVTQVIIATKDYRLAKMTFAPEESPYHFVAMVPQNVTEKILLAELERKGGQVEYNTTFVSAEQQDDGVSVTLESQGTQTELKASFVVGCDGAHSAVRHQLNLPFEGGEYSETFMLADVETNGAVPADELLLCPNEFGPVAIFPMSLTRDRVVATIDHPDGDAPTLDLVQRILAARAPSGIEAGALHWSSYFRIHHRRVSRLRSGRMFIAGDAAHIHSPFGGQGMNTGLQDVWNLAWKLDLTLHYHGNEQLLESYNAERIPVIKGVLHTTDLMTKVMGTPSKWMQVVRNAVIPMVSGMAPFQHAFVQRLSELGIAYSGSPIVEGPGERYFEDTVRGGDGIRSRYLLIVGQVDDATAEAAKQLTVRFADTVGLRSDGSAPGLTLVRPDGYIAYETNQRDAVEDLKSVRSLLERQTVAFTPDTTVTQQKTA